MTPPLAPVDPIAPTAPGAAAVADAELAERAIAEARALLDRSVELERPAEARRGRRLARLLDDADGRELLFELTDQVLRIGDPAAAAARFADIVRRHDTSSMGFVDRRLLRMGAVMSRLLPRVVMPLVVRRLRAETAGVVLPADGRELARHLARRHADGVDVNVNPLGEAILSDAEADERMRRVLEQIERPDVDHVSVKASAIVAHLDPLAADDGVDRIVVRLREIFRASVGTGAGRPSTFVNLDMEEYRDLELTSRAFVSVLDEPEFAELDAGIVVQAYLPDSHGLLERLGEWSAERRRDGGGRIRVRLVKGANLAMERVEAELHGWRAAPYPDKASVDASYKALVESALRPDWDDAVLVGIASHNLFDIAWAHLIAERDGQRHRMRIEMLEGMAPAQARAVHERLGGELRMYAPVVTADDFVASLAYLSRRLDENTQPDNFLRHLFGLADDLAEFDRQADRFRRSVRARHGVPRERRRSAIEVAVVDAASFENEPDADFTDRATRSSVLAARPPAVAVETVETVETVEEIDWVLAGLDGSIPDASTRRRELLDVASTMSEERALTLALMADGERGTGKTFRQGDPEVSEAIDFCRYYATVGIDSLMVDPAVSDLVEVAPAGVVAVIAPWNFPYAIPTGGVAAALAAGNRVVLKPAPEAVYVGAWIVDQFRRAGVDESRLRLVVCDDGPVGRHLVEHPAVDSIVLTGSFETAQRFLDWRPRGRLFAETSGKNALVITAAADLDLAIADLVASAFGHAGQKCSAASLAIVEASVYDDPGFRRRLGDATRSLRVGAATDPATIVGPLIGPPGAELRRALTELDDGESWLVEPRRLDDRTWTPGVRLGVAPGSWFHRTECFGPVLGVMRADDLDHAIELQNAGDYALTGGVHSLDDSEIDRWLERVEVGNAYVNRGITGAIVRRQPFGGWKSSAVGGGAKAGGPGHVAQFARFEPVGHDLDRAVDSYRRAWRDEFATAHDPSGLTAESNVLRYRPLNRVVVRHAGDDESLELLRAAAAIAGVELIESDARLAGEEEFVASALGADRVRLLAELDDGARRRLHRANVPIDSSPPVADGRTELRRWVREQSICRTMHRHGRLLTPT